MAKSRQSRQKREKVILKLPEKKGRPSVIIKTVFGSKAEPISPTKRKILDKQKKDQRVKQNLTQDYAYTGIPGAIAEPAGVTIPAPKKPKLALRGGGRAYGKNS
tara:strand:- start:138 stop:449 length:312 start_codon:yes stop_codon:yes gene_type:complete